MAKKTEYWLVHPDDGTSQRIDADSDENAVSVSWDLARAYSAGLRDIEEDTGIVLYNEAQDRYWPDWPSRLESRGCIYVGCHHVMSRDPISIFVYRRDKKLTSFLASDGYDNWRVDAETSEAALKEAIESVQDSGAPTDHDDWSNRYTVSVYSDYGEPVLASKDIVVDPPCPECCEGDHQWERPIEVVGGIKENPGVWGHGGGVTIKEVCRHCGIYRHTDTWHTDSSNGETYEALCYDDSDEASEIWMHKVNGRVLCDDCDLYEPAETSRRNEDGHWICASCHEYEQQD